MVSLSSNYVWLSRVGLLPRMVSEGLKEYGTVETLGAANNSKILGWGTETGTRGYSADSIPWCGLFVAVVASRAGKEVIQDPLWALNWAKFGTRIAERKALAVTNKLVFDAGHAAMLGDVLVFRREGGGHVGIYIGEDATAYHVLGGNQSDKVCITRVAKDRCVAIRRPTMTTPAKSMKPYYLAAAGGLSSNEA